MNRWPNYSPQIHTIWLFVHENYTLSNYTMKLKIQLGDPSGNISINDSSWAPRNCDKNPRWKILIFQNPKKTWMFWHVWHAYFEGVQRLDFWGRRGKYYIFKLSCGVSPTKPIFRGEICRVTSRWSGKVWKSHLSPVAFGKSSFRMAGFEIAEPFLCWCSCRLSDVHI